MWKTEEELLELSLDEMLTKINFKSIEVVMQGSGWVGTRYVLHTFNYGSSHTCETFDELKGWIVRNLSFQLRT